MTFILIFSTLVVKLLQIYSLIKFIITILLKNKYHDFYKILIINFVLEIEKLI